MAEKTLVDTMILQQDIGTCEAHYKKAIVDFWSDGSVTWRKREGSENPEFFGPTYVGDKPGMNAGPAID